MTALYKIVFTVSAVKQLNKLSKSLQKLVVKKIKNLNIKQQNNNIKRLSGLTNVYRLRVGNHRVIYQVRHEELIILVLRIGNRG